MKEKRAKKEVPVLYFVHPQRNYLNTFRDKYSRAAQRDLITRIARNEASRKRFITELKKYKERITPLDAAFTSERFSPVRKSISSISLMSLFLETPQLREESGFLLNEKDKIVKSFNQIKKKFPGLISNFPSTIEELVKESRKQGREFKELISESLSHKLSDFIENGGHVVLEFEKKRKGGVQSMEKILKNLTPEQRQRVMIVSSGADNVRALDFHEKPLLEVLQRFEDKNMDPKIRIAGFLREYCGFLRLLLLDDMGVDAKLIRGASNPSQTSYDEVGRSTWKIAADNLGKVREFRERFPELLEGGKVSENKLEEKIKQLLTTYPMVGAELRRLSKIGK